MALRRARVNAWLYKTGKTQLPLKKARHSSRISVLQAHTSRVCPDVVGVLLTNVFPKGVQEPLRLLGVGLLAEGAELVHVRVALESGHGGWYAVAGWRRPTRSWHIQNHLSCAPFFLQPPGGVIITHE